MPSLPMDTPIIINSHKDSNSENIVGVGSFHPPTSVYRFRQETVFLKLTKTKKTVWGMERKRWKTRLLWKQFFAVSFFYRIKQLNLVAA